VSCEPQPHDGGRIGFAGFACGCNVIDVALVGNAECFARIRNGGLSLAELLFALVEVLHGSAKPVWHLSRRSVHGFNLPVGMTTCSARVPSSWTRATSHRRI
jgi:hypothetical protein